MNEEVQIQITPRAQAALDELQEMIAAHFPQAEFATQKRLDPAGIYLVATVDIDDTDEVVEIFGDRLVDIQVEEGIPVYVTVLQPRERVMAQLREQQSRKFPAPLPGEYLSMTGINTTPPDTDRIVQDPAILSGKPVVRGTRIPVEMVLDSLAHNPDFDELLADYPRLTMDDVKACLAYARSLAAAAVGREEVAASASS